ncbi:MAG: TetR/AcrR family transcriptional regulator [Acidimicrobiia bacterium]|nr:TetR/AcrR family transcriptional regulator [Acidimicrobiia bacterium]
MQGTRPRPVQARSRERMQRILDAAVDEFAELGYEAASTTGMARRAGVSIGSLYQYFPDKEAVLVEIAERHLDEASAAMAVALEAAAAAETFEGLVAVLVDTAVEVNHGDPRLHQVLYREAPRPRHLQARLDDLEAGLAAWLADRLEQFGLDAERAHLRARAAVVAVEALVHEFVLAPPAGITSEAARREVVRAAVQMVGVDGSARRVT